MTLGNKAPKTFEAFLKHKRAGDDRYNTWRREYRAANGISELSETLSLPGNMPGVIPAGAKIERTCTIAGYGSGTAIRDAGYLTSQYGGDPLKWAKKGGIIETNYYRYDVHWYELDGVHYKEKVKGVKEK